MQKQPSLSIVATGIFLAFAMHPGGALAFDEPVYESETVASTTATTISDLKRQLQLLQQRLDTLEQSAATPKALPKPVAKPTRRNTKRTCAIDMKLFR